MSALAWLAGGSILGGLLGTSQTNRANVRATKLNNAHQLMMSSTAHQREVKDLKSAGLNPILSSRSAGAPIGSSAAARVEPYKPNIAESVLQAQQIKLLEAQTKKTRAEAVNTELMEPYNKALSNVYGSVLGEPAVGMKTLGTAGSAFGVYQGGKAIGRILKRRKAKTTQSRTSSVSRDSLFSRDKFRRLIKLHKLKTKSRNRFGLRPGEYIDRRTGEIKIRGKTGGKTVGKSGGGFSLRKGYGNRSGRYNKFNKF